MLEHDGVLLPVSYFRKMLQKAEINYVTLKLELMVIIYGKKKAFHYLCSRKFTILFDGRPLKYYTKITSPTDIIAQWLMQLSEYDYTFQLSF